MAMDVEVKAPPAEGEAKPKAPEAKPAVAGEPLDPESEAQAAMAVMALMAALPPCKSLTVVQSEDGGVSIECVGEDDAKLSYAVSSDAIDAATMELAGDAVEMEDEG